LSSPAEALGERLDRHLAANLLVDAAIDDSHAAASQHVNDLVLADAGNLAARLVSWGIHVRRPPLAAFRSTPIACGESRNPENLPSAAEAHPFFIVLRHD
jgi:hypothetical protein